MWPYKRLEIGDTLYWYSQPQQQLIWESVVSKIDRFKYENKEQAMQRVTRNIGEFDKTHRHIREGQESGYCFALRTKPIKRLNIPKPDGFNFPRLGWITVDDDTATMWFGRPQSEEEPTLDHIADTDENPLQIIRDLSEKLQETPRERIISLVAHTVRKDSALVNAETLS